MRFEKGLPSQLSMTYYFDAYVFSTESRSFIDGTQFRNLMAGCQICGAVGVFIGTEAYT